MAQYDQVDDFVSGNELAQQGKYFLIHVPNYNDGTVTDDFDDNGIPKGTSKRNSYLRLGAAAAKWTEEPGADLVRLAYLVGPAGKQQDPTVVKRFTKPGSAEYDSFLAKVVVVDQKFTDPTSPLYDAELKQIDDAAKAARKVDEDAAAAQKQPAPEWPTFVFCPPFIDDQRSRGTGNEPPDGSAGHGLTPDARRSVSEMLHTRGGWRDHSDGNRITTTRGDKIEVIQGSYKLIVMGRQTDTGQGMGWEASGNNVQDFAGATMPGASVTVEWVNHRYGGVWLLQNSTENVYQYSRNAGNFREQNWGDLWETYVGSENPPVGGVGLTDADGLKGHPTLRDEPLNDTSSLDKVTHAKLKAPSVSSKGLPRGNPHIVEKTWASKIESYTGSESWQIPHIIEETWAVRVDSKTQVGSMTEVTNAGAITSHTNAGVIVETTIALAIAEATAAAMHISVDAGPVVEVYGGVKLGLEVAGKIELSGPFALEASVGYSGSFHNFKDEMKLMENKVTGVRNDLTQTTNDLANTKTCIAVVSNDLLNTKTELATAKTQIATQQTQINTAYQVMAGQVFLG